MFEYRTEVVVPPDRYVCLQLPENLPPGRARVTVMLVDSGDAGSDSQAEPPLGADVEWELDRQDIEWWDEFDEDRERVG